MPEGIIYNFMDNLVNLIRYIFGVRQFDNWNDKNMYYVLTKSGNFADWLHIRRQIKYREKNNEVTK